MASLGDKFVDMVLTVAIILAITTGFLVSQIYNAQQDENLSAYAGLLALILVIVIIGLIRYVWVTMKGSK